MEPVLIRAAKPADAIQMLNLIKELADYEKAADQVTVSLDHFIESGFGENPVWWAIVAEDISNMQIVGMALYYIRYSTWKGQRMFLEDIVITETWRNKGLGKLMMNKLFEIAEARKLSGILWQVLNWNEDAIRFYKKYPVTFDDSWINVSMDLI